MFPPLTKVLIKIFANGFYRIHAGLLLSLFVTILIYFLFINVLNQTHLPPDQIILYNLSLVLALVSNPVITGLVFLAWLLYTIKSWQYVAGQLKVADQQFLFYSSTSFDSAQQFKSWFLVQLIISLPVAGLGVFAVIIGIIFKYYLMPIMISLYLVGLNAMSALYYVRLVNRFLDGDAQGDGLKVVRKWPKPLFSLFLYQVAVKGKLTYGITKLIAWAILACRPTLFADVNRDLRVAGILLLGVSTAHAILIYQSHEFEKTYLRFARNFPYSRLRRFAHFAGLYGLLLLPESLWLLTTFRPLAGIGLVLFGVSTALLLRSVLYGFAQSMRLYLPTVFGLFILWFLLIMFGLVWALAPFNLLVSWMVFYRNYPLSED